MKEYFENESVFWTPISKCCWLETKSRNQKDIWNCWPCFSPTPFFGQTVNPISTKGNWTPNLMFWKWMHILKILLIENLECTSVRPVGAEHRSIVDSSVNRVLLCSSCFPNSHTDRGDTMPCNNNSCCFFSPNVWTSSKIGRMNSNRFVKWCGLRFWFCK